MSTLAKREKTCGEPLMYGTPSSMHATAYSVEGEISASLRSRAARKFTLLSFMPATTCRRRLCVYIQGATIQFQIAYNILAQYNFISYISRTPSIIRLS